MYCWVEIFYWMSYFRQYMNRLCSGQGANYFFKPQQVNVVMVTPGQDLPLHYDNGWFWGANRFSMPDWLTVAMTRSGMFKDIEIPQAQSVVYLHGSKDKPVFENGGEYVFYPNGKNLTVRYSKIIDHLYSQTFPMAPVKLSLERISLYYLWIINNHLRSRWWNEKNQACQRSGCDYEWW